MNKDWLKLYSGLGSFNGLESPPTENKITVLDRITPNDSKKALKIQAEKVALYYAYLDVSHNIECKEELKDSGEVNEH